MTIKEQYRRAYNLLRDRDYGLWDFITYRIICDGLGISDAVRIAALQSYNQSRLVSDIGEAYRYRVRFHYQLKLESILGYMPYLSRDLLGRDSESIDYGIREHIK